MKKTNVATLLLKPPSLVFIACCAVATILMLTKTELEAKPIEKILPVVRVVEVYPKTTTLMVSAQGVLSPKHQVNIISEVDGKVTSVNDNFVSGGTFKKGDVLFEIDRAEYESALTKAEVTLKKSKMEFEFADNDIKRIRALYKKKLASNTDLDQAERAFSRASSDYEVAKVQLADAQRKLQQATVTAPFDGKVLEENVAVEEFIRRGEKTSTIYQADLYEVKLPIPSKDIEFLAYPSPENPATVHLTTTFAGTELHHTGQLVRLEAEMDTRSNMITGIVDIRVEKGTPAVPLGLFVHAEIEGREVEDVYRLHRRSVRNDQRVLLVDQENRLRLPKVNILRNEGDFVLVNGGITPGSLICESHIDIAIDGMEVSVVKAASPSSNSSSKSSTQAAPQI
ncbi:efflux RND transporter periplasmic adaptor subunit [Spongiibacter sp. KMU-158]|uniref:Efflux RND transporter periplasmic adaptor subunit n=1 Tax=Spongiibacter pelagi TaxID=2760804 RepID=A0A927GVD0_9GAMM|nr:efflux RND transporter periplasmic adaptor subunit [Spongiibacter pelagi]MBD2857943.1 efflux RND transporter periplasmic adaptor subunit [Spongiibacter pelagi]